MRKMVKTIMYGGWLILAAMSHVFAKAADPWQMNMYQGVTPIGHAMYDLHMIAIYVCAAIGIVVYGVMVYAIWKHRKSKGHQAAHFHENLKLEIIWTLIPFLILVGLAVPATRVLIQMDNTKDSDITVKIVGSQWKWQYQYLNEGISFYSNLATPYEQIQNKVPKGQWYLLEVDKPLVLPVHKKIRFLVTSQDVIHSWWVPELGVKRDAIPGFMYESWAWIEKPGTYRGQCTELCGINHGFMPIVVQAVEEDAYQQWLASQKPVTAPSVPEAKNTPTGSSQPTPAAMSQEQLMKLGKQKYRQACMVCHAANGRGMPPVYPALKGSSVSIGKPISRHINVVLHGVAGSAMQGYHDQLTDQEIAAIVTYERNAWGNNTNDVVQPADVAKVRAEQVVAPKMVNKVNAGRIQ